MFGGDQRPAGDAVGQWVLLLDQTLAFELSAWCAPCQFLFQRLDGANDTLSIPTCAHDSPLGPTVSTNRSSTASPPLLGSLRATRQGQ
jgi:hypothetical protein